MGERIGGWRMGNGGMGRKRERGRKKGEEQRRGQGKLRRRRSSSSTSKSTKLGRQLLCCVALLAAIHGLPPHPCTHPPTLLAAGHPFTHTKRVLFEAA